MTTTYETNASIGPDGLLQLTQLPFPEGWTVHVKVESQPPPAKERKGFPFGLHAGMVEMSDDFNDPLPDSFFQATEISSTRRAQALAALNRIASRGGIAGIADPMAWEREQRADRPLRGRES